VPVELISSGLPEKFGRRRTQAVMISGGITTDFSHAERPRSRLIELLQRSGQTKKRYGTDSRRPTTSGT
jgi:hypothetical protein